MLVHEDILISEDILEKQFVCDLNKCKGICCVEGEYGAPLEDTELEIIQKELPVILPYMTQAGRDKVLKDGFHEKDPDGDIVTQCLSGRDCVFAISEAGVYKCAIEKAWEDKKTEFKKPISCHLYPIRVSNLKAGVALNYSKWYICSPACSLGKKLKVPMYAFLKEPLVRRFGTAWYEGLDGIAREYAKR